MNLETIFHQILNGSQKFLKCRIIRKMAMIILQLFYHKILQ